jgi:hypothetical protein
VNDDAHVVRKPGRTLLFVLMAFALVGVVLCVLRVRVSYLKSHVTLPDGSTVELLGTTVGLAEFKSESKLQRVARFLPAVMQKQIPRSIAGMRCGTSNSVTVYLRVKSNSAVGGSAPWGSLATEDEDGFRFSPNGGVCSSSDGAGNIIYGVSLNAFPRRQPKFLFRMLDQNGAGLGTLQVQNPILGPFPEWRPDSLPQTKSNGPVVLTLKGFEEHAQGRWTNFDAKWELRSSDATWASAKTRRQSFLDATGNDGFKLSPRETAWKARTLVYREGVENFATNEQLVLPHLALPAAGAFTAIDQSSKCSGVELSVLVIASAGRFGVSNGVTRFMLPTFQGTSGHSISSDGRNQVETWGGSTPFLLVEAKDVQPDDEIQFRVIDDHGREVKVEMNGYESVAGAIRTYRPAFNPSAGTKWVTVQALVNRPLRFEFIVKPEDVVSKK